MPRVQVGKPVAPHMTQDVLDSHSSITSISGCSASVPQQSFTKQLLEGFSRVCRRTHPTRGQGWTRPFTMYVSYVWPLKQLTGGAADKPA